MVRIKERYLLVNILYPPDAKASQASVPVHVVQHQPTREKLTPSALVHAIKAEVTTLFGDYGAGAMEGDLSGENISHSLRLLLHNLTDFVLRLIVKYLSLATSTIIIRCSRAHYKMLWAALTFMTTVPTKDGPGRPCIFRVVRVSGTVRKAEEEAIRQAKQLILAAKEEAGAASGLLTSERTSARDVVMDVDVADESDEDEIMSDSEG